MNVLYNLNTTLISGAADQKEDECSMCPMSVSGYNTVYCIGGKCAAFLQISHDTGICGMIPGALHVYAERLKDIETRG